MKTVKFIGIAIVVLLVAVVVYANFQPREGQIQRTIVIKQSPDKIYRVVSTLKTFNEWSPWFTIDPETKYTYEGPHSGIGAKMSWQSNNSDVGAGSQWIIGAKENQEVHLQLDFGFAGGYYSDMLLKPVNGGTEVTWVYRYDNLDMIGAFFTSIMDAEGMVGENYEEGLQQLTTYVESLPVTEAVIVDEAETISAEPADE